MKTKKKSKKTVERKSAPVPQEDMVYVSLSKEELHTLINLMAICSKTFESLAMKAAQENDKEVFNILAARQKLSNIYLNRLMASNAIGEPDSREYH